jgi:hypothetical protein
LITRNRAGVAGDRIDATAIPVGADAKPHDRKPTYILFIFAQGRSRAGRKDASLSKSGIHG